MDQLIAQDIEPVKNDGEDSRRIPLGYSGRNQTLAAGVSVRPVTLAIQTILVIPERSEYVLVIQQYPDFVRKSFPYSTVDSMIPARPYQRIEIGLEHSALAIDFRADFACVGGIQTDPSQYERTSASSASFSIRPNQFSARCARSARAPTNPSRMVPCFSFRRLKAGKGKSPGEFATMVSLFIHCRKIQTPASPQFFPGDLECCQSSDSSSPPPPDRIGKTPVQSLCESSLQILRIQHIIQFQLSLEDADDPRSSRRIKAYCQVFEE